MVDTRPLIRAVVADVGRGLGRRSSRGDSIRPWSRSIAAVCGRLRQDTGLGVVVLSGGVFLNALLTVEVSGRLARTAFGCTVIGRCRPTTAGLSLGQLAVASGLGEVPKERPMCLGIPGKVVETYREHDVLMGKVDFSGICKRVCLEHVAEVRPGDYVLVHVGFALSRSTRPRRGGSSPCWKR